MLILLRMVKRVSLVTCFIVPLLICAGATSAAKKPGGADSIDRKTGMAFPSHVGLFERARPIGYDPLGYPEATYVIDSTALATVFYYKQHPFPEEYAGAREAVKKVSPSARLIWDGPSSLHPGGRHAIFSLVADFAGHAKVSLTSELFMFPHRDLYLAFRITYPSAYQQRHRQEIDAFIKAFRFP
jgi:hypothetical protein